MFSSYFPEHDQHSKNGPKYSVAKIMVTFPNLPKDLMDSNFNMLFFINVFYIIKRIKRTYTIASANKKK